MDIKPRLNLQFPISTILLSFLTSIMSEIGVFFVHALRYVPSFTVRTSLKLLPFRRKLPNESKQFVVDGLKPHQATWFVECVDRKSTDPVVVFLHGGGYFLGLNPFFMIFLAKFYKAANDERLSILVLDYTLTTKKEGMYPRQLNEVTLLYKELQKTCTNISLLGDSAGGHLALNLIRHNQFSTETEKVPLIEDFTVPNRLILMSPWLNPTLDYKARHVAKFTHFFSLGALTQFQKYHMRPMLHYSHDPCFKQILHSTLVIYGAKEALRGDIEEFIEINQKENIGLTSKMIKGGMHDSGVVWPFGKNEVATTSGQWFSGDHYYV
ncbi:hypothetical protein WICPIJ_004565 [Wickerhamomyces pijperi]|uniref:Alpha/beta hydrolase fold-3 domain-containing protein n=1 Tax=Wickerhamomyces pijperi TaxID=599730 RepID=A0A9P8TN62_WICPI|nr:hypothetical protein WICPIJ_004565 [Wickerhamomyces pijperi]